MTTVLVIAMVATALALQVFVAVLAVLDYHRWRRQPKADDQRVIALDQALEHVLRKNALLYERLKERGD